MPEGGPEALLAFMQFLFSFQYFDLVGKLIDCLPDYMGGSIFYLNF
ncbi:MAG: hypothetical protein ABFR82_09155 [Nitrospirota bacterium]